MTECKLLKFARHGRDQAVDVYCRYLFCASSSCVVYAVTIGNGVLLAGSGA